MKILNRKQFLTMPSQTLYCKYEPTIFEDLNIKVGETDIESIDFCCDQIMEVKSKGSEDTHEILCDALENGTSFKLDLECTGRDGLFEDDQLFAVFEKADIEQLIERLKKCL